MSARPSSCPVRRAGLVTVALVLGALLTGCATLPDSSSVQRGHGDGVQRASSLVFYHPPGPQPGADKTDIVEHYLQAMLAFPQAPDVVRQFLTPNAARSWIPDQQLRVYQSLSTSTGLRGGVSLRASILGSLDERGSWVSADSSNDRVDEGLALRKIRGEWRISDPPPGTLIDADFFTRYYRQYSLYFFDASHTLLTPDPVYVLQRGPGAIATELVSNLLQGPTGSMGGVVSAEVPRPGGGGAAVTVSESGIADVRLPQQYAVLPAARLRHFAVQLTWTLLQDGVGVSHVLLRVGNRLVTVPGHDEPFTLEDFSGYDPTVFAASRTLYALSAEGHLQMVFIEGTHPGAYPVPGGIGSERAPATAAAVAPNSPLAALVTAGGTRLIVGSTSPSPDAISDRVWFQGADHLIKPSWDVHDLLWLVDRTPAGAVVRVATQRGDRVVHAVVDARGISGQDVRAFAVSRDGTRVAAILGRGSTSHLVIAMVQRSATSSLDVALTAVRPVRNANFPVANMTALAWFSPTSVMVLGQVGASEPQPYQIAIDGSRVQPTTGFLPVQPRYLAAGSATGVPPVIGSADGRLYARTRQQQWPLLLTGHRVFAPVYVG